MAELLDWNVAVYCVNEATRLRGCLDSIAAALAGRRAVITVILNGSRDRSLEVARAAANAGAPIEIFQIAMADKSNAINQFYYTLRLPARAYAGVDGYAFIGPDSFRAMEERLNADPHALAVTGVAANGRTMTRATKETLTVGGRLHGQFHALRPEFLDRMVAHGIKLPVGLYRGDGLLGSIAAHNLDPLTEPWDNARIPGVAMATYEIPVMSPFKLNDIRRQFRRKIRQMRGQIENEAIASIIYRAGYEALPNDADDMIQSYLATHDIRPSPLVNRVFQRLATWESAHAVKPEPSRLVPHRVAAA
jgi:hypothetical protein